MWTISGYSLTSLLIFVSKALIKADYAKEQTLSEDKSGYCCNSCSIIYISHQVALVDCLQKEESQTATQRIFHV